MSFISHPIYTEKQVRKIEQFAIQQGIVGSVMMRRAGTAAFTLLQDRYPRFRSLIVFCGSGNNGGDGYVLARLAQEENWSVEVRYTGELDLLPGEAKEAMEACRRAGVSIQPFSKEESLSADMFVDALLGIGLKGVVRGAAKEVIEYINKNKNTVMSLDLPSGLCADTGKVLGEAIFADLTITFIGIKQGLLTGMAVDYSGALFCDELELPQTLLEKSEYNAETACSQEYASWLKPRSRIAHKGSFGHVLVVGGEEGMSGAPFLAAQGAARSGAGLVSIATRPQYASTINVMQPEIMVRGIEQADDLLPLLEKASVVVIGPGLGQSAWSKALLEAVFSSRLPLIVDADAINDIAQQPKKKTNWILTPHPGEAARLLKTEASEIQVDRFSAVRAIQKRYGGVVVLKGARTLIASEGQKIKVCLSGNPGMASGGMGDLLAGIIAGLVAQGFPLFAAASCGVCLHGESGDQASQERGERGLLATDLLLFLQYLVNLRI